MRSSEGTITVLIVASLCTAIIASLSWITVLDMPEFKFTNIQRYETKENQTIYGYSSTVDQTDSTPFITADGTTVKRGIIANNCYEFGTVVYIEFGGICRRFTVRDRMNKRYGCEVWDIWFETRQEALDWGKRIIDIKVYK